MTPHRCFFLRFISSYEVSIDELWSYENRTAGNLFEYCFDMVSLSGLVLLTSTGAVFSRWVSSFRVLIHEDKIEIVFNEAELGVCCSA